jgi:hypothetical protein
LITTYCKGATINPLPTTSVEGIAGTWAPALNNMATTTYTFTPDAGLCASTATLEIVVNEPVTTTFTQVAPICKGATLAALPTSSNNTTAITGTWAPAVNNQATTTYTFTPTAGQCATTATMEVVVNAVPAAPTANNSQTFCSGSTVADLVAMGEDLKWYTLVPSKTLLTPTTTLVGGIYYATQTLNGCESGYKTVGVTVKSKITPTFIQVAPICKGASLAALPTFFADIIGTWAPALNNLATTSYTFTPTAGQCANIATMTIVVNEPITPTFTGNPVVLDVKNSDNPNSGQFIVSTEATYRIELWGMGANGGSTFGGAGGGYTGAEILLAAVPYTFGVKNSATYFNNANFTINMAANNTTGDATGGTKNIKGGNGINNSLGGGGASGWWGYTTSNLNGTATAGGDSGTPDNSSDGGNAGYPGKFPGGGGGSSSNGFGGGYPGAEGRLLITKIEPLITTYCKGASINPLPTISAEGITGSWAPALDNMATTTYTFTPTTGLCANTATITIVVNDLPAAPTANQNQTFCTGNTVADLVATGTNIKWYTFDPSKTLLAPTTALSIGTYFASQSVNGCESDLTGVVVVVDPNMPTFTQVAPICKGASLAALPTTSTNTVGITGTWSPSTMNNMATTTYTFTPNAGQCASTAIMEITVNNCSVISGTVLEDADAGSIDGTPLTVSNAYLSIYKVGEYVGPGRLSYNTTTVTPPLHVVPIVNGAYAFPILAAGKYKIVIGTSVAGSETASYPNVGSFTMTSSAEGEAGTTGDGTPDGITFVTISENEPPVYSGSRIRADAGISFALKQLAPLPVRLISFTGKSTEIGNELTWKTSTEVNFSHFEVERSENAKTFEKIGKVDGNKGEIYEFIDKNSSPIIHHLSLFYRLKMVDLDGTFAYSKIIALNAENSENSIGQIYPNPSNGEAKVSITTSESGNWTMKTFDITGKLLSKETISLQKGVNEVELKKLYTGMNYIQVSDGKTTEVRKVLKQ